jgi:hypothetical protein
MSTDEKTTPRTRMSSGTSKRASKPSSRPLLDPGKLGVATYALPSVFQAATLRKLPSMRPHFPFPGMLNRRSKKKQKAAFGKPPSNQKSVNHLKTFLQLEVDTVRVLELGAGTGDYSAQICSDWLQFPGGCEQCIEYYVSDYSTSSGFLQGITDANCSQVNQNVKLMPRCFGLDANKIVESGLSAFNLIVSVNPYNYGLMAAPPAAKYKIPWAGYTLDIKFLKSIYASLKLGGALAIITYTSLPVQNFFKVHGQNYAKFAELSLADGKKAKALLDALVSKTADKRIFYVEPRSVNRFASPNIADLPKIAAMNFDVEIRRNPPQLYPVKHNRPDTKPNEQRQVKGANTMIVLIKRTTPGSVRFD